MPVVGKPRAGRFTAGQPAAVAGDSPACGRDHVS